MTPIEQVLDLARWAPSGDNTQPWHFQIISATEAILHTFDTRHHCVYDLTGAPSQIAVGAMLETARIAATGVGMRADIAQLPSPSEEKLQFRLRLVPDPSVQPSNLIQYIESRCTDRRPFERRSLSPEQKAALEASVGSEFEVLWLEGPKRREIAWLMFESAKIRLTIREAYEVHKNVIEWNAQFSESKIPDSAVGLDPIGTALMRWAMKSWPRTNVLSNYLGGTLLPRVQLELLPGIFCAAHLILLGRSWPAALDDHIQTGCSIQRLWLTATKLKLQMQPEMTPLIFADYVRKRLQFSTHPRAAARAAAVRRRLVAILGERAADRARWMSRVGFGSRPNARSVRLSLSDLQRL